MSEQDFSAALRTYIKRVFDNLSGLVVSGMIYLGHHLGRRDAIRFLRGGLVPERARKLLNAQIGTGSASRRIAEAGNAAAAHRVWLLDYVGRNIRPERFRG